MFDSLQLQAGSCWHPCWTIRGCCPPIVLHTHSGISCHAPSAAPPPPALASPESSPDVLFPSAENDTWWLQIPVHADEVALWDLVKDALMPYHQCERMGPGYGCTYAVKRESEQTYESLIYDFLHAA